MPPRSAGITRSGFTPAIPRCFIPRSQHARSTGLTRQTADSRPFEHTGSGHAQANRTLASSPIMVPVRDVGTRQCEHLFSTRTRHLLWIAAVLPRPIPDGRGSSARSENRQGIERRSCSFFDAQRRSREQKLETIKPPRLLDRSLEIEIIENVYAHRD
jgi:hypothetical protein